MSEKNKTPSSESRGFTVGDRIEEEGRKKMEEFKKVLEREQKKQARPQQAKEKTFGNTQQKHFVAASMPENKPNNLLEIEREGKKPFTASIGSEKFPQQLNKYELVENKDETTEELQERLHKGHAEMQKKREELKELEDKLSGLNRQKNTPRVMEQKKGETPESKFSSDIQSAIQEATGDYQKTFSKKKEIIEKFENESDPEKKKKLWDEKNRVILVNQINWGAIQYQNAKTTEEKERIKINFLRAKELLREYDENLEEFYKKHEFTIPKFIEKKKSGPIKSDNNETTIAKEKTALEKANSYTGTPISGELKNVVENKTSLDAVKKEIYEIRDKMKIEISKDASEANEKILASYSQRLKELGEIRDGLEQKEGVIGIEKQQEGGLPQETANQDVSKPPQQMSAEEIPTQNDDSTPSNTQYIKKMGEGEIPQDFLEKKEEPAPSVLTEEYEPRIDLSEVKPFIEISSAKKAPFEAVKKMTANIAERAKKLGALALKMVEDVGNNWNKAGKSYKYALLATAFAGVASGGAAYIVGASALLASRIGGSAAVYVGVEAALERARQKKETIRNKNPKLYAAAVGASVFLISEYLSSIGEGVSIGSSGDVSTGVETSGPSAPEALVQTSQDAAQNFSEHIVSKGERLWDIVGTMDGVEELSGAQKENAIANIVAAIRENPSLYGVASGNVDQLAVGDTIDMEKIHDILEMKQVGGESIVEHAKNLTPEQIENIEVARGELIDYRIHHPNEPFTTETTERVLRDTGFGNSHDVFDMDDSALKNLNETSVQHGEGLSVELSDTISEKVTEQIKTLYGGTLPFEWNLFLKENINIPAEDILDKIYFDINSKEEYLKKYLEELGKVSGFEPIQNITDGTKETVGSYIGRALSDILEKNPYWKPPLLK